MLSINFIKENIELVEKAIKEKNSNINLDEFLKLNIKKIKIQTEVESLRAKKNELSKAIKDNPTEEQIKEGKKIKEDLLGLEENLTKIEKEFTCHSLRHSFAINLVNQGIDIEIIRRLLGHSSIRTTQIYLQCRTINLTKIAEVSGNSSHN